MSSDFVSLLVTLLVLSAAVKTIGILSKSDQVKIWQNLSCPEENISLSTSYQGVVSVRWPETTAIPTDMTNSMGSENLSGVVSEPLCLSAFLEPITRRCLQHGTSAVWHPKEPPYCEGGVQKQFQNDKICPPPFTEISTTEEKSICVFISMSQKWKPLCVKLGATTSILDLELKTVKSLKKMIRGNGVKSLWLPARRHQRFGPIISKLPGNKWGTKFINKTNIPPHFKLSTFWSLRNDCLSLRLKDLVLETNNCDDNFPILCMITIANETSSLIKLSHPNDYFAPKYNVGNINKYFKIYNNLSNSVSWGKADKICREETNGHLMAFSSEYDIYLFLEMIKLFKIDNKTKCWIGLTKDPINGFVWKMKNSTKKAYFVNWDTSHVLYFNSGNRGVIYANGKWRLIPEYATLKCFVCEVTPDNMEIDISLKYTPLYGGVLIRVHWPNGLWKESVNDTGFQCFTDAAGDVLHILDVEEIWSKQWTLDDVQMLDYLRNKTGNSNLSLYIHKKAYKLNLGDNFSGNYWCEGHRILSFDIKESNKILILAEEKHTYSLVLDIRDKCDQRNMIECDPTFSNILDVVATDLFVELSRENITALKAMRILDVYDNGTLRILFHIRSKQQIKLSNENFSYISDSFTDVLKDYTQPYTFKSFMNSVLCPADVTYLYSKILRWKSTAIGATAVPAELCIGEDGIPIYRKCVGNFTIGATWLPPSGKCHNVNVTVITQSLHSLAKFSEDCEEWNLEEIAEKTVNLLSNPLSLGSADAYFVAIILKNLAKSISNKVTLTLMTTIIKIVNQLQMARRECIYLSQTFFNSTNIILDSIEIITEKLTTSPSFKKKGLYLAVYSQIIVQISDPSVSNITGLIIKRKINSKPYSESFEDFDVISIEMNDTRNGLWPDLEKADIAIWVPESILSVIDKETEINSGVFKTDDFKNLSYYLQESHIMNPKIVISVFYDDLIFQNKSKTKNLQCSETVIGRSLIEDYLIEEEVYDDPLVITRVVSLSIPGYGPDLPAPIPIIFKPLVDMTTEMGTKKRRCAYWDFAYNSSTPSSSHGGWSEKGCIYVGNSSSDGDSFVNVSSLHNVIDVCVCTHLTHFSELVSGGEYRSTVAYGFYETDNDHMRSLDTITIAGCALSLAGILGIIITAIVFRSWRQKPGTKVLLQLSFALGMQMILFILTSSDVVSSTYKIDEDECVHSTLAVPTSEPQSRDYETLGEQEYLLFDVVGEKVCPVYHNRSSCIVMGALLHYFVLSSFTWMLITALLQFFRYVRVLGVTRPPRFFLKAMIFGWGVPVIPVVLVLILSPSCYTPPSPESTLLCYPSGYPLYFSILAPIGVIVTTNLIVYVTIIYSIMKISGKESGDGGCSLVFQQIRLGVVLFFLLGLSWVFGLMAAVGAGITFSFLFCITGTLQGFVLFLFFVVFDPSTRHLWVNMIVTWKNFAVRASTRRFRFHVHFFSNNVSEEFCRNLMESKSVRSEMLLSHSENTSLLNEFFLIRNKKRT